MEAQGSGAERREFKRLSDSFLVMYRVKSPFEVRIKFGERELDAVASDISEGGLGLTATHEIPTATMLQLKFSIYNDFSLNKEDNYRAFDLEGNVRYCRVIQGASYQIGIRFVSASPSDRQFIVHYIETNALRRNRE
jgi:c-di-GMP-binding flagellar brake protein YcgR